MNIIQQHQQNTTHNLITLLVTNDAGKIEPPVDLKVRLKERDELVNFVKDYYSEQNVGLSVSKSSNNRRVKLKCYCGETYRNPLNLTKETRQRNTGIQLTDALLKLGQALAEIQKLGECTQYMESTIMLIYIYPKIKTR